MKLNVSQVEEALILLGNQEIAQHSQRFFKTGKGDYGEGDRFLGIRVPVLRKEAKKYKALSLDELLTLLQSPFHEIRLFALIALVNLYQHKSSSFELKQKIFDAYLNHTQWINNWDLVDVSAHKIVGPQIAVTQNKSLLVDLTQSTLLWDRRIAMISCFYFIQKQVHFDWVLEIAKHLVYDSHDLMHKAVGWMLRELGKRSPQDLYTFLDEFAPTMPRTALRYALERVPKEKKQTYMKCGKS